MEIRAVVGVANTEEDYEISLQNEPHVGDVITLTADGEDKEYLVLEANGTGFSNGIHYVYTLYVKPKG